jgi:signal transduction histidine kinase
MRERVPSPAAMWARLVAGALVVGLVVFGAVGVLGPVVLAAGADAWGGWAAWSALAFAVMTAAVMSAAAVVVRRARLLYLAVVRARQHPMEDAPPPSEAALRDAFDAPRWLARTTGLVLVGALLVHALFLPPAAGGGRPALVLLAGGGLTLGLLPTAWLWQRAMWPWLEPVPPSDVPLRTDRTVALPVTLAVGTGLLGSSLVAMAVWTSHAAADGSPRASGAVPALLVGLAVLGLLVLAWARREGQRVARDLRALGEDVDALRRRQDASAAGEGALHTQDAARLSQQVAALADRHARSLAEEADARRAIEEVQRLKSRFMAYVSHDLRSPLNSIKGFAEILARGTDGPLDPAQHESVDMIRTAGDELLRLVNDILDAAKLESGHLSLRRRWIPSVEILTEAVRQVGSLIGRRDIEIVTELEPGLPPVHVDRDRVVQAVESIFAHVVRVMAKGTIRLRAGVLGGQDGGEGHLRVEVIDESGGLGPEDRERLFEAFRAVREPSGRRIGGLGLGLSLARGLVVAHGGDVWCERRDRGGEAAVTAFCVSLPLTMGDGA